MLRVDVENGYTIFTDSEFGDFIDEHLELKSLIYFLDDQKSETIREFFRKQNTSSQSNSENNQLPIDPNIINLKKHLNKRNLK